MGDDKLIIRPTERKHQNPAAHHGSQLASMLVLPVAEPLPSQEAPQSPPSPLTFVDLA